MIEVEAPDGTIVEFPDDMPTAEIERVMRQTFGGPDEGQQPQAQTEGDRGFLAFLNQGIATTLGAPVDAVNWGLRNTVGRVVPGAVSETPFLGSASIANMLRSGGVRVADVNQKAEGMMENIGSGLGGAAGGLVLGGGALAGLARSTSPMAQAAARTLAHHSLPLPSVRSHLRLLPALAPAWASTLRRMSRLTIHTQKQRAHYWAALPAAWGR